MRAAFISYWAADFHGAVAFQADFLPASTQRKGIAYTKSPISEVMRRGSNS